MRTLLDGAMPGIRCPNCYAAFSQTVAELKGDPTLTCASCGATTTIDLDASEMDAAAKSVNDAVEKLAEALPERVYLPSTYGWAGEKKAE